MHYNRDMNILFLFQKFSFESSTIYLDLVKECVSKGHKVYVLAGTTDEVNTKSICEVMGCKVAYVQLPDQFHAGKIKKGIVQLLIEPVFLNTLKRLLWNEHIDLIAYPTPPITLAGVVKAARTHYGCRTCLMLKDIFPQNAADLGMMNPAGALFKYFKWVEKRLYDASDVIGCMSLANIEYMKRHCPMTSDKLILFPNTVKIKPFETASASDEAAVNFVVGGNLGEPQGLDFLMEGIRQLSDEGYDKAYFTFIGDGTRATFVSEFITAYELHNARYLKQLPRDEYEELLARQDVGIISLNNRFTIPNFPSRLLSYMQKGKPVFVVTDRNCDMGEIVEKKAQCGFFVPAEDTKSFCDKVKEICRRKMELGQMGINGRKYLEVNYDVSISVGLLEDVQKG